MTHRSLLRLGTIAFGSALIIGFVAPLILSLLILSFLIPSVSNVDSLLPINLILMIAIGPIFAGIGAILLAYVQLRSSKQSQSTERSSSLLPVMATGLAAVLLSLGLSFLCFNWPWEWFF